MFSRSTAFGVVALLASVALVGLGAVPSGALTVGSSQPTACEGFVLMNPTAGTDLPGTISIDAELSCYGAEFHYLSFFGSAASGTTAEMCAGVQVSVQFAGTEFIDSGPAQQTANWTMSGRSGNFAVTTASADGTQRTGAFTVLDNPIYSPVDNPPCNPDRVYGTAVLAGTTPGGIVIPPVPAIPPVPEVFHCHATASVGQFTYDAGAYRPPTTVSGEVQGTGTCQSSSGIWQVTLSGRFAAGLAEPCPAGNYTFSPLELTKGASTLATDQFWDAGPVSDVLDTLSQLGYPVPTNAGDGQTMVISSTDTAAGAATLAGVGHIQASPHPCTYYTPFQVTADWVFATR